MLIILVKGYTFMKTIETECKVRAQGRDMPVLTS